MYSKQPHIVYFCILFFIFYSLNCQTNLSSKNRQFEYFITVKGERLFKGNEKFCQIKFQIKKCQPENRNNRGL